MRWWIVPVAALVVVLSLLCSGCGNGGDPPASPDEADTPGDGRPLRVVATIGMIADIAGEVAGERATVLGLIAPGVDPHLYRPTRSDVQRLMDADLILANGLRLEGKMLDALRRARESGRGVVLIAEAIDESALLASDGVDEPFDPHLWMDPLLWIRAVEIVRDALVGADPVGASTYTANADRYAERLRALHDYAERVLSTVPPDRRVLVTAHDAFGYFGRRYAYEVVAIQGISTESEAGVRDIERMVELLVARRIGAVFVESTVSDRNISALIGGAGARGHTVLIGGELFSDAMGNAGTYEGTYLGMIDHNATTIARALGGDAPERGMQGRLAARRR